MILVMKQNIIKTLLVKCNVYFIGMILISYTLIKYVYNIKKYSIMVQFYSEKYA